MVAASATWVLKHKNEARAVFTKASFDRPAVFDRPVFLMCFRKKLIN